MQSKLLYDYPGKIDQTCPGWEFVPSESKGGMTYNPAEGYYADKGGRLLGPMIKGIEEFEYYCMSFAAECQEDCHWAVMFFDADENLIVSDVYSSIYKDQKNYKVVVYGREGATALQPVFQSVSGVEISNLLIEKISSEAAAECCDDLYKTLPALECIPVPEKMRLLPKTAEALKSEKEWRVVMLGDSIINDTFNSNFQALVQRNYPDSKFKWICSVRGSTSCWFYQEQENFQEYVIDLKPDLLIIGGISHKGDIGAIKKVVDMTREQLGCELALASGPFGYENMTDEDNKFCAMQKQLAHDMNIEFIDMRSGWLKYLESSEKPYEYFYRDVIHGNDRGKQIAGRIIVDHFNIH